MGIIETILSSETVILAVIITTTAIGLKALLALLQHGRAAYDYRLTIISSIVGFLISIQIVVVAIEHLPVDAAASTYLTLIAAQVLAVMGIDSAGKKIGQKLLRPTPPPTGAATA